MRLLTLLVIVMLLACSPLFAWQYYLDGTTQPSAPWLSDNPGSGATTLTTAFDGSSVMRVDSGTGYNEYYFENTVTVPTVGGARFSLQTVTTTGTTHVLAVVGGCFASGVPTIGIAVSDGRFKIINYTNRSLTVYADLGPAVANEFHTAYIVSDGLYKTGFVIWDGVGISFRQPDLDPTILTGYVEWGAGSWWWGDTAITVDFDWVGYGDVSDLPAPTASGSIGSVRNGNNSFVTVQNAVGTFMKTETDPIDGAKNQLWAEDEGRAAGLHVLSHGALPLVDAKANLSGFVFTAANGEKQLSLISFTQGDPFTVEPLYLNNKNLGPVPGSAGLATDGMLVKVSGKVTNVYVVPETDPPVAYIYLDDGSGVVNDIAGFTGVKVTTANMMNVSGFFPDLLTSGPAYPYEATVTGIVRLEKLADGTIIRWVNALSDADIVFTAL